MMKQIYASKQSRVKSSSYSILEIMDITYKYITGENSDPKHQRTLLSLFLQENRYILKNKHLF